MATLPGHDRAVDHSTTAEPAPPEAHEQEQHDATELSDLDHEGRLQRSLSRTSSNSTPGFWRRHIYISVAQADCRDHFANERTFLSYLRTSLGLAAIGVTVAQLMRLEHTLNPSPVLGYYVVAKPLGALFQASAIGVQLVGAHRFWRQQRAMSEGRALAGGWEIYSIMVFFLVLIAAILVLLIAIDVREGLG